MKSLLPFPNFNDEFLCASEFLPAQDLHNSTVLNLPFANDIRSNIGRAQSEWHFFRQDGQYRLPKSRSQMPTGLLQIGH